MLSLPVDVFDIARICHEANRAYCETLGDLSQKPWDDADQWQRESAMAGVETVLTGVSPAQMHEAWCQDKVATGWRHGVNEGPRHQNAPLSAAVRGPAAGTADEGRLVPGGRARTGARG